MIVPRTPGFRAEKHRAARAGWPVDVCGSRALSRPTDGVNARTGWEIGTCNSSNSIPVRKGISEVVPVSHGEVDVGPPCSTTAIVRITRPTDPATRRPGEGSRGLQSTGCYCRLVRNARRSVAGAGRVVLITGPMGTGKSSLAEHLAHQLGWASISEDTIWVQNGWGSGLRSPEQEDIVQRHVVDSILERCWSGRNVVLEFILYAEPPNPLSAYAQAFAEHSIACDAVVLKASVSETMRRITARGRPGDLLQLAERRSSVEHQLRVVESEALRGRRIIDTSHLSVEQVSQLVCSG